MPGGAAVPLVLVGAEHQAVVHLVLGRLAQAPPGAARLLLLHRALQGQVKVIPSCSATACKVMF